MGVFRRSPRPSVVRLPIGQHLNPVVEELALNYDADPEQVGRLLRGLASAVLALDALVIDPHAEPWQIAMATEAVEAVRGALLGESLTAGGSLDLDLTPADADRLAADLTVCAATVRQTSKDTR